MEGCDIVFHLAAYTKVWAKDPTKFYRVNVEGTINVLSCTKKLNIDKVIVTSTAGVLGPSDKDHVNENIDRSTNFFTEYERTKFLAEQEMGRFVREGLNVTILLPTRLYGPGELNESNSVTVLVQKYMQGKWHILPGNGKKIGNYVFIKDVINGHIKAMENNTPGERFILGGVNINYEDFFNLIGILSKKKQWLIPLPVFIMMIISNIFWFLAVIFKIKPLITPGWVKKYLHNWSLTSIKAIKILNYKITPLEKGLLETISWLKTIKEEEKK